MDNPMPKRPANPPAAYGKKPWEFKSKSFKVLKPKVGLVYQDMPHVSLFDDRVCNEELVLALKVSALKDDIRYNATFVDERLAEVFVKMEENVDEANPFYMARWFTTFMDEIVWVQRTGMCPEMLVELAVRLIKARQMWLADANAQQRDGNRAVSATVKAIDSFLDAYYDPERGPRERLRQINLGNILDKLDEKGLVVGTTNKAGNTITPDCHPDYDDPEYDEYNEHLGPDDDFLDDQPSFLEDLTQDEDVVMGGMN